MAKGAHARQIAGEVRTVLDEPTEPAFEGGHGIEQLRLHGLHGIERHESHHGADPQWQACAIRQLQDVIEKSIFSVPQAQSILAHVIHRAGDVDEVFPEFAGHVLIRRVLAGQLKSDAEHVQRVHCHPTCAVRLLDTAAARQRRAAVKHTDVVQTQKAALKDVHAFHVLAVDPPGEVQKQFVEHPGKKLPISFAAVSLLIDEVNLMGSPGMDRRIHITQRPFVRRDLSVGVHVPLPQHENKLFFGKIGVNQRQSNAMKREIPGGVPGELPLVRHGDNVSVVNVSPGAISPPFSGIRRRRNCRISDKPVAHDIVIELLAPQKSSEGLAHDVPRIFIRGRRNNRGIELVGLRFSLDECVIKIRSQHLGRRERRALLLQTQPDGRFLSGCDSEPVADSCFCSLKRGVHCRSLPVDQVAMKRVFHIGRRVRRVQQAFMVGLIFGEQHRSALFGIELISSDFFFTCLDRPALSVQAEDRPGFTSVP